MPANSAPLATPECVLRTLDFGQYDLNPTLGDSITCTGTLAGTTEKVLVLDDSSRQLLVDAEILTASGLDQTKLNNMVSIDPLDILYVYSWGMGAVLTMWSLGFGVGIAKTVIKMA